MVRIFLPIIRSGNGKFFGFGESKFPELDQVKGRFAQLLPTKVPDAAIRDFAKAMLKVKGVTHKEMGRSFDAAARILFEPQSAGNQRRDDQVPPLTEMSSGCCIPGISRS